MFSSDMKVLLSGENYKKLVEFIMDNLVFSNVPLFGDQ